MPLIQTIETSANQPKPMTRDTVLWPLRSRNHVKMMGSRKIPIPKPMPTFRR